MKSNDSANNTQKDLGGALIDSILTPHVAAQAGALTDVAFNNLTTVAVFSEIPVLDIACKIYGVLNSIRNDLFLKKLAGFLSGCDERNSAKKSEFEKKLEIDGAFRSKVGEGLLLILERIDHFEKTQILGKVFAGRLRGDIDEVTFYRLATAISNIPIGDLKTLEMSYEKVATYNMKAGKRFAETLDDATSQALYNVGFLTADGYTEMTYLPNDLGSNLIRLMKR